MNIAAPVLYCGMKKTGLLTLILICTRALSGLSQDTTYFDAGWKETPRDKYRYFKTKLLCSGFS